MQLHRLTNVELNMLLTIAFHNGAVRELRTEMIETNSSRSNMFQLVNFHLNRVRELQWQLPEYLKGVQFGLRGRLVDDIEGQFGFGIDPKKSDLWLILCDSDLISERNDRLFIYNMAA